MDQGYGNLALECVCLDDVRLVKVKQLLMSWRCMPADIKNMVCWPKGSEEMLMGEAGGLWLLPEACRAPHDKLPRHDSDINNDL